MCETKGCRKKKAKTGRYCYSCLKNRYKARHPERYAYSVLKNNAKRRGKQFEISFEYFKKFAKRTEYMAGKGITKTGLHIDRKKEELGYIPGNLQAITNSENIKKYLKYEYDRKGKPTGFKLAKSVINNPDINDPF